MDWDEDVVTDCELPPPPVFMWCPSSSWSVVVGAREDDRDEEFEVLDLVHRLWVFIVVVVGVVFIVSAVSGPIAGFFLFEEECRTLEVLPTYWLLYDVDDDFMESSPSLIRSRREFGFEAYFRFRWQSSEKSVAMTTNLYSLNPGVPGLSLSMASCLCLILLWWRQKKVIWLI